jgi:hypothetical protein
MLLFEWDTNKARRNLEIHGVSFDEASTAFKDTLSLTIRGPLHSDEENAEGTNVVVIEPDVAKIFPGHDSVNQALRSLTEIIKRQKKHA